jgi:hypothetical protein
MASPKPIIEAVHPLHVEARDGRIVLVQQKPEGDCEIDFPPFYVGMVLEAIRAARDEATR